MMRRVRETVKPREAYAAGSSTPLVQRTPWLPSAWMRVRREYLVMALVASASAFYFWGADAVDRLRPQMPRVAAVLGRFTRRDDERIVRVERVERRDNSRRVRTERDRRDN
jgi:hypothetical protein